MSKNFLIMQLKTNYFAYRFKEYNSLKNFLSLYIYYIFFT